MSIVVTDEAIDWIKYQCESNNHAHRIRIGVTVSSSCGTHSYFFEFCEEKDLTENDNLIHFDHKLFTLVVDEDSLPYLQSATVDIREEGLNKGLAILNEQESHRCGCGKAVTF